MTSNTSPQRWTDTRARRLELSLIVRGTSSHISNAFPPEHRSAFEAGSTAAKDASRAAMDGPDWQAMQDALLSMVGISAIAIADHLTTLAKLIEDDDPPIFGAALPARSALEGAALLHWLLAPGLSTGNRMRRAARMRLDTVRQMEEWIGALRPDSPEHEATQERVVQVCHQAEAVGYSPKISDHGKLTTRGPQSTPLIETLFRDLEFPPIHRPIYGHLSAVAHAVPGLLVGYMDTVPDGQSSGAGYFQPRLDLDDLRGYVAAAVPGALRATHEVLEYLGRDSSDLEEWIGQAQDLMMKHH